MEGWSSSDAKLVKDATAEVERDSTAGVKVDVICIINVILHDIT